MFFSIGDIVKHHRTSMGISQEQLADGICSRETISLIELGKRLPKPFILTHIVKKLGLNLREVLPLPSADEDLYTIKRINEIIKEMYAHNWGKVRELIADVKNDTKVSQEYKDHFIPQFYVEMATHTGGKYFSIYEAEQLIIDFLKQHRPAFDLEKLSEYFLTRAEANMVRNLVTIYYTTGKNISKGIEIMEYLVDFQERWYRPADDYQTQQHYATLIHELIKGYIKVESWEKALELCEKSIKLSRQFQDIYSLQFALDNKVQILFKYGRAEEARQLLKKLLMAQYGTDYLVGLNYDEKDISSEAYYQEKFGVNYKELIVPWELP